MTHVLLQQPRPAKAHVICSSLLLSWCFSFCNIIRNGCLAVPLPNQVSSWDSWDFTNTGHCKVIHLHKSPGAYSHMFQNKPEKSQNGTGHDDLAKKIGQKSSKGASYLTSVGPMDPKNSTCLLLKEWEKENIRIHINASSAAAAASSVASASASASLAWGFYSWSRATCRLRKKKCPNHHSPQLLQTCATHVSQPIQAQPVMYMRAIQHKISSRRAKTHFICSSLLLSWCFSFCNVFRSGLLAMELTPQTSS